LDLCHPGGEGGIIFILLVLLLVFLLVFRIVFRISVVVVIGIVARGGGGKANGEKRDEDAARTHIVTAYSNTPLVLPPLSTHLTVITHVNTSFIYSCNIVTTCSRVYHW
jgi:hypothetical protein